MCVCILLNILELCFRMQLRYLKTVWSFQGLLLSFVRWARAAFTLVLLFSTTEAKSSWVLYLITLFMVRFFQFNCRNMNSSQLKNFWPASFWWFFPCWVFPCAHQYLKTWKETSAHFWSSLLSVQLCSPLSAAVFSLVLGLPILAVLAAPDS